MILNFFHLLNFFFLILQYTCDEKIVSVNSFKKSCLEFLMHLEIGSSSQQCHLLIMLGVFPQNNKKSENIGKSIIIRIKQYNIFKKKEEYIRRNLVKFIQFKLCMVPLEWFSKSELDSIIFLSLCCTYSSIIFNLQLSLFIEVIQENMNSRQIQLLSSKLQ